MNARAVLPRAYLASGQLNPPAFDGLRISSYAHALFALQQAGRTGESQP